ncbi:MAG: type II toxin-antitoxin system RelE/ParE family toxin [bacterium]
MKPIEFDYDAKAELADASYFYEDRRKGLGVSFLREAEKTVRRLAQFPESGRTEKPNIRRAFVKKFPYAILYSIQPEKIFIVAVMHCSRKPGYWRERLK